MSKIAKFGNAVFVNQNVAGFYISVEKAGAVEEVERAEHVVEHDDDVLFGELVGQLVAFLNSE